MRITKIEPQQKVRGRRNIFADGKFIAGVSQETLLKLGLRTGDEIGTDMLAALRKTEELTSAKNTALRFLSYRPRTIREVRDKLREKEFSDADITKTINELKTAGLLDDAQFARMYIRNATVVRPAGRILLARKLLALGVPKDLIDQALTDTLSVDDQQDAAFKAAEQLMRRAGNARRKEDPRKLRQRIAAGLVRRGYSWDIVDSVLRRLITSPPSPDETDE